jgi:DNA-binding IclR family transcriptional regulator
MMPKPLLGPVAGPVLAALAKADGGLTVAALTETLGRPPDQRTRVDQAIHGLADRGYVRVLTRIRRVGVPAAVWGATSAGRVALEQSGEAVAP